MKQLPIGLSLVVLLWVAAPERAGAQCFDVSLVLHEIESLSDDDCSGPDDMYARVDRRYP